MVFGITSSILGVQEFCGVANDGEHSCMNHSISLFTAAFPYLSLETPWDQDNWWAELFQLLLENASKAGVEESARRHLVSSRCELQRWRGLVDWFFAKKVESVRDVDSSFHTLWEKYSIATSVMIDMLLCSAETCREYLFDTRTRPIPSYYGDLIWYIWSNSNSILLETRARCFPDTSKDNPSGASVEDPWVEATFQRTWT